jgi:hypothetical protein
LAVIMATVAMALLADAVSYAIRGPENVARNAVQFVLTIGLCYCFYRGYNWARWVGGVLYALSAVVSIVGVVALPASQAALPLVLLLVALGVVYAACAGILFFAPTGRAYFRVPHANSG